MCGGWLADAEVPGHDRATAIKAAEAIEAVVEEEGCEAGIEAVIEEEAVVAVRKAATVVVPEEIVVVVCKGRSGTSHCHRYQKGNYRENYFDASHNANLRMFFGGSR